MLETMATTTEEAVLIGAAKELLSPTPSLFGIALFLFGIFTAQVYSYWYIYVRDHRGIKTMVVALWLLECIHSILVIFVMQWYFVDQIGYPLGILKISWSVVGTVALEIVIVSIAQLFFIYRLWKFSGQRVLIVACPLFLLITRVGLVVTSITFLAIYPSWSEFHDRPVARSLMSIGLIFSVLTDVFVTTFLIYYLRKRRTSFRPTQHMIQQLIYYTVNTGALTSVSSTVILLSYNFLPKSLIFGGLFQLISKLYANSVLALLNARHDLKVAGGVSSSIPTGIPSFSLQFRNGAIGTTEEPSIESTTQIEEDTQVKISRNTEDDMARVVPRNVSGNLAKAEKSQNDGNILGQDRLNYV